MGLKLLDPAEAPSFVVRFPPIWSHIPNLTTYLGALLDARGRSDANERVAIVAHELLENAVKYGDPATEVKFEIFIDAASSITVRVTNKAHPSRVAILERELRRNAATTPKEAFAKALERLQHLPEGSTMLGLSRVTLEAELGVETGGNLVVATARVDTSATRITNALSKSPAKEPIRSDPVSTDLRRDKGPATSQTRRVEGAQNRADSNPSMKAVGNGDNDRKPR